MATDAAADRVIARRVARGAATNYADKIIALGIGFFLTPFILRHLAATGYGLWVLAGSVVAYGSLLDLGIGSAVVKFVAEYRATGETVRARGMVATALCLYTALGLVALMASVVLAAVFPVLFHVPPDQRATAMWLVLLMGVGLGVSIPGATAPAVLRGLQRYDIANAINIGATLLSAAATVAVLSWGGGVLGMVAVNIATTLLMQAPSVLAVKRLAPELRFGWRGAGRRYVRTIASFSVSLFAVQVAWQLHAKTDEIVIAAALPVRTVTPYALAHRLSDMAQLLTNQFVKVLLPLASQLHAENDHVRLRQLYLTSTRVTLAIFLPLGCVLVSLAGPILTAWVGVGYAAATPIVVILTLASFLDTSQWPAASILQGMGRHRPLAFMSLGSGVANLVLSIALVRPFGVVGVALGTLIPITVECTLFVFPYALRVTGVGVGEVAKGVLLPVLAPLGPMAVALYLARDAIEPSSLPTIALVAMAGLCAYGIVYLGIGASAAERHIYHGLALSIFRAVTSSMNRT